MKDRRDDFMKEDRENRMENSYVQEGKCPGCDRHCDLSDPHCGKGEAIAKGVSPEELEYHGGHDFRRNRTAFRRQLMEEKYASMSTEEKLGVQFGKTAVLARAAFESGRGQRGILKMLEENGEMTQKVLTMAMGIRPGSASELMAKLEKAGYITRTENEEDRRTVKVAITEEGSRKLASAPGEKPDLFGVLNDEEKAQLLSLLEKLTADWEERFPAKPERPEGHHGPEGRRGPRGGHGPEGRRGPHGDHGPEGRRGHGAHHGREE